MNTALLEQARIAKQKADNEQALIDALPELEAQEKAEQQKAKMAEQRKIAALNFETTITDFLQDAIGDSQEYNELQKLFRQFIRKAKQESRAYDRVWTAALSLGYFLASEDTNLGLSVDSQRAHAEDLMKSANIQTVNLPQPKDPLEDCLILAIRNAMRTV